MLGREEAREIVAVLVEEVVDPEEEVGALRKRPGAPLGEGSRRGGDCAIDVLDAREVDLAALFPGRGVEDSAFSSPTPRYRLPADPVVDQLQLRRHRCAHLRLLAVRESVPPSLRDS